MAKFTDEDETVTAPVLRAVRDITMKLEAECDSCKGTGLTVVNRHDYEVGVLNVKVGVCRCVSMWVHSK